MIALTEYGKRSNIKTIFVEAHQQEIQAVNFYHSVNGSAEKVVHFNFLLK
jgi:aminoglycoside 3-N-acetyltransferase I